MFKWLKTIFGRNQLNNSNKEVEIVNKTTEEKAKKPAPKKRGRPKKKT